MRLASENNKVYKDIREILLRNKNLYVLYTKKEKIKKKKQKNKTARFVW